MTHHPPLLALLLLALSACQSPAPSALPPTPSPRPSPIASLTPITIRQPSPTPSPSPSSIPNSPYPAPQSSLNNQPSEIYNLQFSLPIGSDGVQYQGVGVTDMQITGPNALAALPDGSLIISDLLGDRLLNYSPSGKLLNAFDLSSVDVVNISDLVTHGSELYLLEISFNTSPVRCRVDRLAPGEAGGWKLSHRYDIPQEFCSEGGLSGIFVDQADQLLLEIAGGSQVYLLANTSPALASAPAATLDPTSSAPPSPPALADGYSYYGRLFRVQNGQPGQNPRYQAGEVTVQTALSYGLGGFRFLDAFPDGHSYLIRDDVVNDQTIQVDQTVSDIGLDGVQRSVARFPASESLYYIYRNLAVGPDGAVYGLLPRENTLDVIRLNFFSNLPPLIPTAAEPVITVVSLP